VSERTQEHVAPYMAEGLSTVHGIGSRKDIERNLQTEEPLAGRRAAAARRRGRDLPGQHRPPRRPGSFTRPARAFPGARYIAPAESPDDAGWENIRDLWSPPADE
jgi:hypothetical protein